MKRHSKIYVAGHTGLVGSALMRALVQAGFTHCITRGFDELDLRDQNAVHAFFMRERPEYVFLAAAKVGGIKANNDFPADFIYDNLMIEANILHAAYRSGVTKLLFLGSSCIYPRDCQQPIKEEYLMTGPLEKTNEPYALAKIAGIGMCQAYNRQYAANYISCMPTNLFGPEDNFDPMNSHVLPGMIGKMFFAKQHALPSVELWGDGTPRREFLYVDDLADALIFLMQHYHDSLPINIGMGEDISISELAQLIKLCVGYQGELVFNTQFPNGTPRKLLDVSRLHALGWRHTTSLQEGIQKTIAWYQENMVHKKMSSAFSYSQNSYAP
jgi:GDP-L-fucose synthase